MRNFYLLLLLSCSVLLAENIPFQEKRYIYALNNTIIKNGTINASKNDLTIFYSNGGQKLTYAENRLTITKKGKTKVIDLDKDIVTKLFFVVLQAIFHDDREQLKRFFTIESKGTQRILYPKELASKRIVKIVYKKNDTLDYLHIYLKNGDRISIEQTDEIR